MSFSNHPYYRPWNDADKERALAATLFYGTAHQLYPLALVERVAEIAHWADWFRNKCNHLMEAFRDDQDGWISGLRPQLEQMQADYEFILAQIEEERGISIGSSFGSPAEEEAEEDAQEGVCEEAMVPLTHAIQMRLCEDLENYTPSLQQLLALHYYLHKKEVLYDPGALEKYWQCRVTPSNGRALTPCDLVHDLERQAPIFLAKHFQKILNSNQSADDSKIPALTLTTEGSYSDGTYLCETYPYFRDAIRHHLFNPQAFQYPDRPTLCVVRTIENYLKKPNNKDREMAALCAIDGYQKCFLQNPAFEHFLKKRSLATSSVLAVFMNHLYDECGNLGLTSDQIQYVIDITRKTLSSSPTPHQSTFFGGSVPPRPRQQRSR